MAAVAVLVSALPAAATPSAESPTGGVVISQVYGGGGNTGATFKNDFVELFNAGTAAVSVTGWSVQYASATGTTWQTTALAGSIPAGGYYLVQEAQGAGGTAALPTPDATGTIALSATAGKVALVSATVALSGACPAAGIVDFVGFGTTPNCFEGSGPTPAPSNTTAVLRSGGGCTDTDSNAADFTAGAPNPRNSAASPNVCSSSTNPSGIGAAAPSTVVAGGSTLLTVAVTPGTNPTSTGLAVTGDLSSIGGSAAQQLYDDGTHGDAGGGDNTFSFEATVDPATASGAKTLPAAITDAESRSGSASIGLTVTSPSGPGPDDVVVSEVYGGGGNTGATYRNDFIELYNRTGAPISLAGWSVQYGASTGSTWQATTLSGTIAPGGTYLVQEAQGAGGDLALPAPDVSGTVSMAGGAGKVALLSSTTRRSGACPTGGAIIDFVGYGAANCSESAPVAALSNTTSAQRANGGATDTNNNAADFTVGTPSPRGTTDPAPGVSATDPANGASNVGVGAPITITFSEPVSVSGSAFTIACANSGAHTATVTANAGSYRFTLDPDVDFASLETCTVTVAAAQVSDLDTFDPPDTMGADHTFSFTTADASVCGDPATPIHTVQGTGASSPLAGSAAAIEGVVVGDYQASGEFGGFYVQEEDGQADADPATSEAVFVFSTLTDVSVGDVVRARGTVSEFATGTSSLTELTSVSVVNVCSTGASVTSTVVTLPVTALGGFERLEGMRVHFSQTLTATETFTLARFGEVSLAEGGRLYTPTAVTTPGAAALAQEDLNRRRSFVLDDGNNQQNIDPTRYPAGGLSAANTLRSGYTVDDLDGVLDDRFSTYRVQPVGPVSFTPANPRTPAPAAVGGNLKVASFNVLNFFNGDGLGGGFPTERGATSQFELDRQKAKEVSALQAIDADIVGLMEIENDAPPNSAIEELVAGLNAKLGTGTYAFIDTGVIGTDAIKVALIYKPARVTPVGAYQIITSGTDPRFIDTKNRPSLAQTFQKNSNGEKLTVVVNHLKSKGSDCNDVGDPDTGDGQGNCNVTRRNAAAAIVDWLATDPTGSGDPDFLLIGDMNSYTFEDPITTFTNGGFTNLVRHFGGLGAYSYVFDGESGYLDHALASSSLAAQATGATDWHINADEPIALDYNVEFKTANQVNTFYDPGPDRASDHDPVVIGLSLNGAPSVGAGGPYTVPEGGSVSPTATGSDPDGDTLTYDWDLDNDGSFETPGQSVPFSAATIDGPATRTIKVRATDSGGRSAVSSASVTIQNVAPTASFSAPASAPAGFAFTLSLASPSDPASADTFTYAFDCGSGYGGFGSSSSVSCTPTDAGTLTVHGKISDDDGGVTEYAATVEVTVTPDSLCALTRAYSSSANVADKLCAELAKGQLSKFAKEVEKETGEAFTPDQAATLIRLAGRRA